MIKLFGFRKKKKADTSSLTNNTEKEKKISDSINMEEVSQYDKKHIWAFTSGQESDAFRGNPKYLFTYINRYRPDIYAYWLCNSEELLHEVQKLNGSRAFLIDTPECQRLLSRTGVLASEMVKASLPEVMSDFTYLNLWHGIGYKIVERQLREGQLARSLAKKYIHHNDFYKRNQIMLCASDSNAQREMTCLGLDEDHIIRSAYPRCQYQKYYDPIVTFEHDIRKIKNLPDSVKLIVYAPTYRKTKESIFNKAIPDIEQLHECCKRNQYLLIFKMHTYLEEDPGYLSIKEYYKDYPYFYFWDNLDDFSEIMNQIDLAIYDYSSIFSDFLAVGIRHFIRYDFDYSEYFEASIALEDYYLESTAGIIIRSFSDLLESLDHFDSLDCSNEAEKLMERLWGYTKGPEDFDKIIQKTIEFVPTKAPVRNLYSFDVFDTLFSRKVLNPEGIFYYVKDRMRKEGSFLTALVEDYPRIRKEAEGNARFYQHMLAKENDTDQVEIHFEDIFNHIRTLYHLTDEQTELLKKWELEAELDNVLPLNEQIDKVKELHEKGETVILISDMYLSKDFIQKLLSKADPLLSKLPFYLSNEYGVHKASGELYLRVYSDFEPYYDFSHWYHYGDNLVSDVREARRLNIIPRVISKPEMNRVELKLMHGIGNYDACLLAAMQARLRSEYVSEIDAFVINYLAPLLVSYVDWLLADAVERKIDCLYFISRDGYHLKRIADVIIEERMLSIRTHYIYGSRKTWRTASFIEDIDSIFWDKNGNFERISSFENLLSALEINESQFEEFFPSVKVDELDFSNEDLTDSPVMEVLRNSKDYHQFLLERAKEERSIVCRYLSQEIKKEEDFAFVDYYGSGFTQDCISRIWASMSEDEHAVIPFYYSRSLKLTSDNMPRYHFTTGYANTHVMMESVFSNMPYKTVNRYEVKDDLVQPVLEDNYYDRELFESLSAVLPAYAKAFCGTDFEDRESTDRLSSNFAQSLYRDNQNDPLIMKYIGPLVDSPTMYGKEQEFAPAYSIDTLEKALHQELTLNDAVLTHSVDMSVGRSEQKVQDYYKKIMQLLPEEQYFKEGILVGEDNLKRSMDFENKYYALKDESKIYKEEYEKLIRTTPVKNLALFVVNNVGSAESGLSQLQKYLKQADIIETDLLKLGRVKTDEDRKAALIKLASARYVFVDRPILKLCSITFRDETKEILIPPSSFYLNWKGVGKKGGLRWNKYYSSLSSRNDFSVIQISSLNQKDFYQELFSHNHRVPEFIPGCCNLDYYYEKDSRECRDELESLFPEAKGKKVVLLYPELRPVKECEVLCRFPDLDILKEGIGDEYVVVSAFKRKEINNKYSNVFDIEGFSKLFISQMSLKDLAIASDIIISDYRSIMFDCTVLRKPMYSFAWDAEEHRRALNAVQEHYDDAVFCPVVKSSEDIIHHLKSAETYDFTEMDAFRNKYLDGCRGDSKKRILQWLKEDL